MKRRLYGNAGDHIFKGTTNTLHSHRPAAELLRPGKFVFGELILDILVFADEPDFVAEIILRLEEAGNFNVYPINGDEMAGDMQIPSGDVAVIASARESERTAALLARLEQIGVPAVRVGDAGRPDANHLPNLSAPDGYSALSRLLGVLDRKTETGGIEANPGIRPAPAEPDDAAG